MFEVWAAGNFCPFISGVGRLDPVFPFLKASENSQKVRRKWLVGGSVPEEPWSVGSKHILTCKTTNKEEENNHWKLKRDASVPIYGLFQQECLQRSLLEYGRSHSKIATHTSHNTQQN